MSRGGKCGFAVKKGRKRLKHSSLLLLLALLACESTAFARLGHQAHVLRIRFDDDLHLTDGLSLVGALPTRRVTFVLPKGLKPATGCALHMFLEHSPALDGDRSFLAVSLNYGLLRSMRLDERNKNLTHLVIPLPPEQLKSENELLFSGGQFSNIVTQTEDLWTRAGGKSFLEIWYDRIAQELDLGQIPASLFGPIGYGTKRLAVLLPHRPTSGTLEATALVLGRLSKLVLPQRLEIEIVQSVGTVPRPLLIVGTPREQPQLFTLRRALPLSFTKRRRELVIGLKTGRALDADEGVMGLAGGSGGNSEPILFVTGNSPAGVLKAAQSLLTSESGLSGTIARIREQRRQETARARDWKGFVPAANAFRLADLGWQDLPLDAPHGFSVSALLEAMPDTRFLPYGHRLSLQIKLNPDYRTSDAHFVVMLNGTALANYSLKDTFKRSVALLPVTVPARLLGRRNELRIAWKGTPPAACHDVAAWLLASSLLYLPNSYEADLPNLRWLQFNLFPFSLKPDLSDVTVVVSNELDKTTFAAFSEMAAALARLAPGDQLAFRVRRQSDLTRTQAAEYHLIFLIGTNAVGDSLTGVLPILRPTSANETLKKWPLVQEMVSPWNSRKYTLLIRGNSGRQLLEGVRGLFSEPTLKQLEKDTAYLVPGRPTCLSLVQPRIVEEFSYLTLVEAWLRGHWVLLPLILIVVSALSFVALRLALEHYEHRSN